MRSRRTGFASIVVIATLGLAGCGGNGGDRATASTQAGPSPAVGMVQTDELVTGEAAADAAEVETDGEVDALLAEIESLDDVAEATELEVAP